MINGARYGVLLGLSSPTDAGQCAGCGWDSRHVTEHSERVGPHPSVIGYVAKA
jgi:hypothetical protein